MNMQELKDSALRSIKNFNTTPQHRELYKFTHLERFFEKMESAKENESVDLDKFAEKSFPTFLVVDGELKEAPEVSGLKVTTTQKQELKDGTALSELHHQFNQPSLVFEVAKNTKIDSPIRVLNLITRAEITAPTLVVRLGNFSELTLIEESRGLFESYAQVSESYIQVNEGARLEHVQLEAAGTSALHHGSTWASVQKDGSYRNFIFSLSGKLIRRNLDITLHESGANGESYELFLVTDDEHVDINSVMNHQAPDTTSNQLAKGLLDGDSKGIFTGKIFIHPKAQRVASGQLNKNLLLSKKAHIHSQPQLEIFADDVKCSHGSTTGQMSDEEVFYFETRGIPPQRARTLLAYGFGLEVVLKLQNPQLRQRIQTDVMNALREKFKIGDSK